MLGVTTALAQEGDGGKRTPIDSYPLPQQEGAMRYTLADRWDHTDLTFALHNCPATLDCNTAHEAVRRAFNAWASLSALTFTEVTQGADIDVRWSPDEEGFGVPGGTLAFAFFPSYGGDVYFDDAERWTAFDGGAVDLYVVAAHEIGHALGMDHTDDSSAVMYAYSGGASDLGGDDIAGIQRLYGATEGDGTDAVADSDLPDEVPAGAIETVESRLDGSRFYEVWLLDVSAGETVTLTMEAMSGNLDAYLGLLTPDRETVLAEDDDGHRGTDSRIVYTFPTTDTYAVIATRYNTIDGNTTGEYRLTAERHGVNAAPTATPTATPRPQTVDLTIANTSGVTLCYIYISPTSDTTWGSDLLGTDGMLESGFFLTWAVQPGVYDVRVDDCTGNHLDQYYIEVTGDMQINVLVDRFTFERP